MKIRLLVFLFSIIFSTVLVAQTDTLFWFAVPYSTTLHDGPLTADLTLTATDLNKKTTVTISQPYNPQISPITVIIDPTVSLNANVNFTQTDLLKFSNKQYNTTSNSVLLIRADNEISVFYETHRQGSNPAIFTLKGQNALGYDFWTPFQNQWPNHVYASTDPAFSQILVVATKDNTQITFTLLKDAFGHPMGTFSIILDKGQTYMIVPKAVDGAPSINPADRLVGTHITSNKPIAVTLGDDSVQKSTSYDYLGDQCIPVKNIQNKTLIGQEYIVMKSKIGDVSNNEKVYVLVTQPNTIISVTRRNGEVTNYGTFAPGYQLAIDMLAANNDFYVHINASQPVYVLHIAGFTNEMSEAILPTIDGCTGSLSVSFTRSKNEPFYLNLMTKGDAIDGFYISINGGPATPFLDASQFEQAGTSDWYVLKDANKLMSDLVIPTGSVTRIFNTKNVFQLGFFNGVAAGGGCVYGYFSNYNELEASANVEDQGSVFQVCGADFVELKAEGGISYHWSPSEYIDDPNAQNPILSPPPGGFNQVFSVAIEHPCEGVVMKQVWVIISEIPSDNLIISQCDSYIAPDGAIYTTSGIKTANITSPEGCEGVITIDLTILKSTSGNIVISSCDSYTAPDGAVHTTSGIKTAIIPNLAGCDSTITIDLTILKSTSGNIVISSCDSYTAPDGAVHTTSGNKTAIIPNSAGCDSIIAINLTIDKIDPTISREGNILTALEPGALYQWLDCNNGYIPLVDETNQTLACTTNGNYAVEVVKGSCTDTSEIEEVSILTLSKNIPQNGIMVYPNPTNGVIHVDLGADTDESKVVISDFNGSIVKEIRSVNQRLFTFPFNAPSGIYIVTIISNNKKTVFRLVKN